MKVLVLAHLPPVPANDGGRARIHEFAANIAKKHDVLVVCPPLPDDPPPTLPYRLYDTCGTGARRQLFDPALIVRLLRLIHREKPDVLLLEYAWHGLHAAAAQWLTGVPLLFDAFDVVTVRFKRAGHPLWPVISLYERMVLMSAQRVFSISEVDRREFLKLGVPPEKLAVVPGGVDIEVFHPDDAARARVRAQLGVNDAERLLLFFGQLTYEPNADAVRVLCSEVMPYLEPSFRLIVAGRGPIAELRREYENPQVRFLGPVDRIADHINAADAVVAPIRHGSGTRRKLLETVACGVPVVTTTMGAEGLDPELLGSNVLIRDDWPSFVGAVREAVSWPRRRPDEAFFQMHDWRSIIDRVQLS